MIVHIHVWLADSKLIITTPLRNNNTTVVDQFFKIIIGWLRRKKNSKIYHSDLLCKVVIHII